MKQNVLRAFWASALFLLVLSPRSAFADGMNDNEFPLIPQLTPSPTFQDSTSPGNGDVNPYGVAFVPREFPDSPVLHAGDILVSNFNNSGNLQGTGTTIVRVNNGDPPTVFFQGEEGLGLTTALAALKSGFVLVGDLPSTDGSGVCNAISGPDQNVGHGSLLVMSGSCQHRYRHGVPKQPDRPGERMNLTFRRVLG